MKRNKVAMGGFSGKKGVACRCSQYAPNKNDFSSSSGHINAVEQLWRPSARLIRNRCWTKKRGAFSLLKTPLFKNGKTKR
jgi:hypothetical protein